MRPSWWVWKFGGSSLSSFSNIRKVGKLVSDQLLQWYATSLAENVPPRHNSPSLNALSHTPNTARPVSRGSSPESKDPGTEAVYKELAPYHLTVVVSAVGGITDLLQKSIILAETVIQGKPNADQSSIDSRIEFLALCDNLGKAHECSNMYPTFERASASHIFGQPLLVRNQAFTIKLCWQKIAEVHLDMIKELESTLVVSNHITDCSAFKNSFIKDLGDICCCLQTISLTGARSEPVTAYVMGFGELWSMQLVSLTTKGNIPAPFPEYELITLKLNARDVLILDEEPRTSDVRQHLTKLKDKRGLSTDSIQANNVKCHYTTPFLPRLSRSLMSVKDWYKSEGVGLNCNKCSSEQEIYKIGPLNDEGSSLSNFEITWAFPRFDDAIKRLLPPSGTEWLHYYKQGPLPRIHWQSSYSNMARWFATESNKERDIDCRNSDNHRTPERSTTPSKPKIYLLFITGFIASQTSGLPTTLRRNGGDISAVVFGSLLRAEGVTIWSDVAGIYTGDPRYCADARALPTLAFDEALELAGVGAKVLHPGSLLPSIHMNLPLLLKSTFHPEQIGTTIANFDHSEGRYGKVVALVSDVVLFTLSNVPLYSLTSFAPRLFSALDRAGGHPLFISQGSASSATSVAISKKESQHVLAAIVETFQYDVDDYGSRLNLHVDDRCSILSIVGKGQSGFVGALSAWCTALKESNVSIKAVSQSINELSVSFVVAKESERNAMKALHGIVLRGLEADAKQAQLGCATTPMDDLCNV